SRPHPMASGEVAAWRFITTNPARTWPGGKSRSRSGLLTSASLRPGHTEGSGDWAALGPHRNCRGMRTRYLAVTVLAVSDRAVLPRRTPAPHSSVRAGL